MVPLLRDEGRGNEQDGAPPGGDPAGAQTGQALRRRERPPIRRKVGHAELGPGDVIRHVGGDRDEVGRGVRQLDVDEVLQRRQGERAGRVDDGDAAVVPAPAGEAGPLAVERGVSPAAEPPDPRQL
jgi:hypothetical protein